MTHHGSPSGGGNTQGFVAKYADELESMEAFIDTRSDTKEVGFASMYNGNIHLWGFEQWSEVSKEARGVLQQKLDKVSWPLPGFPDVNKSNPDLFKSVLQAFSPYVDFQDERMDSIFASWIIGSGIPEFFSVSPRLVVNGIMGSGKTSVLKMVNHLAYRGRNTGGTTSAVLYRMVDRYRTTYAIDELQRCSNDKLVDIMTVYNCGFDGSPIERFNTERGEVDIFRTRAFMAVASKKMLFQEDELARSVYISMRKSPRKDLLPAPGPEGIVPDLVKCRGDLLGFWLRVRAGREDLKDAREIANVHLSLPFKMDDGRDILLNGRSRSIAEALILPAVYFEEDRAVEDILSIIAESKVRSDEELYESFDVQCFLALRNLVGDLPKAPIRIYVPDVRQKVVWEMNENGNYEGGKLLTTRQISRSLKVLGFKVSTRGGASNKSFIDFGLRVNREVYKDRLCEFEPSTGTEGMLAEVAG